MTGTMTWNGTWTGAGRRSPGGAGRAAAGRGGRAPVANVLQGPWVAGGTWGGRPAAPARRGRATPAPVAVARPRAGVRLGWRRLAALAGDVLMVLIWAAMIPGMMWLGVAAGF